MASAVAIIPLTGGGPSSSRKDPPRLVRLWRDHARVEQLARLKSLEIQHGDYGQKVWDLAHREWRELPEGSRIDLPSPRVFSAVLGLFRTGATLKNGKLIQLELSVAEIAEVVGYTKTTVEAALRWLGCTPIENQGMQVSRGLGMIHRGRRTAWAYLEGKLRRIYRTSKLVLTSMGRMLLGLGAREDERQLERRAKRAAFRQPTPAPIAASTAEHPPPSTAGPPVAVEPPEGDVGIWWIKKTKQDLGMT